MSYRDDYEAQVQAEEALVATDLANPEPGRCRARWQRIADLEHARRMLIGMEAFENRDKKQGRWTSKVFESPGYVALVDEARLLHCAERTKAIMLGWPMWQRGQHFKYLAGDDIREGEVVAFDLEQGLVAAVTWPLHDMLAQLKRSGRDDGFEVLRVEQIVDGERRYDEWEREQHEAQQADARAKRGGDQPSLFGEASA